ncbi:M4 family metallopeptidase, partial [Streptomyces sp. NPDC007251]
MTPLYARHKRTTLAIATAVAAGALLSTGLTTTATAAGSTQALAAAPTSLSAAARTALIQKAQAGAADTARQLGLGAKEQLIVKDVVRDNDGTVHTRYERTYAGLPVLGGDLVVHTAKSGKTEGVTKATKAAVKVASLKPQISAAKAEKQAVSAAKTLGSAKSAADGARKVIWAGSGKPVLAYETVVGGLQDDGTPNQLHVITDAATGKKLFEYQGIENATGTGKTLYSGTVSLNVNLSGSTYQLYDTTRGGHKTYNLARKTSGTGTLVTNSTSTFGTGTASSSSSDQTAAADAAYGAQETWDFYKNTFGRSGIKNDGVGAYSRVHYGNSYVNAFWDDSCFCMTYGDGSGNSDPLTSLDVAGHEMSHGVTSNTAGLNYSGESGGLNEATSDIMGTGVEFYANNASDPGDYLIGEKININGDGTPLRYMDKPSKDGGSAD